MAAPQIRTPDQRIRIFVSSTLRELAAERTAVREAIDRLHLTAVMFETGARHHPARALYRSYLSQSDVFVGIYWQQYGWIAPGEDVSGLEDEYALSGDRPKLIYVKADREREPRLTALLDRVRADDQVSYKHFDDAAELAELLAEDLAILLTERFGDRSETLGPALRRPSLPAPPTALVGRETEVSDAEAALSDPAVRLVTLLGPGGIGKTRLALEVARAWAGAVAGIERPAWFVDLAPVRDPTLWVDALTDALGIRPEGLSPGLDLVVDRLQGLEALLVLDNFEQVAAAAPQLAGFLAACPRITALVTSRTALRLRGEQEITLAPLTVPPAAEGEVDAVARSPAVQLFLARAETVRPGFVLTPANAGAVAELCRRLDGIPLALELAAAQLRVLDPAALLRRLGAGLARPLDLAAGTADLPDRQRTLRATIEWSYSLLGAAERILLARLSVFGGAWTFSACEAVGTVDGDLDALTTLSSLVAQSLVRTDGSDPEELRFRLLDVVRDYAAEALLERGEVDATASRLAGYLIGVVRAVRDELQGPDHREVAERLDRERDEIRSAIDWALRHDDAETVAWFLWPLFSYWDSRGLLPLTHEIAERAAMLSSAAGLAPYPSALLLSACGMGRVIVGQTDAAEPLMRRALDAAVALGDVGLQGYGLFGVGVALVQRDPADAARHLDDAARCFREAGDDWGLALTLSTRGQYAVLTGDHAAARAIHNRALAAAEAIDNNHLRAQVRDMLGLDAVSAGDLEAAREQYAAAGALHRSMLDYEGSAYSLSGLAGLALALDRPDAAARLIGASQRARDVVGIAVWPGMQSITRDRVAAAGAALGAAAFADAAAQGSRMSLTEALAYGLAATGP